jgi:rubrerythrin
MTDYKDLEEMIGVLTTVIVIHEREEMFLRRSAKASTNERAKVFFSEIAEELRSHVKFLEARREKLTEELKKLKA